MKPLLILLFTFLLYNTSKADEPYKYVDAKTLTLIGKVSDTAPFYHRIDTLIYHNMPKTVKRLFTHSAGLAISFKTNSKNILARWSVASPMVRTNMAAIGHSGLDLYIKENGQWIFAGVGRPDFNKTETTYAIVKDMKDGEKECLLYLPLYEEIINLEIGIDQDSEITPHLNYFGEEIIVYGSSITQGASASRPGLAYPAQMSRTTGLNFINLGLSGNAKMEQSVGEMLADINPRAFILDCVPNPSPEQIKSRTAKFVKIIRAKNPDIPIIMVQGIIRESGNFDQKVRMQNLEQNKNFRLEYEKLINEGMKDLFFIETDNLLGIDHEGTTDGVHPTDVGFRRILDVIEPQIVNILNKYKMGKQSF